MLIHLCMHTCMDEGTCASCVWMPKVDTECLPPWLSILSTEAGSRSHSSSLTSELTPLNTGISDVLLHITIFYMSVQNSGPQGYMTNVLHIDSFLQPYFWCKILTWLLDVSRYF